MSEQARYAERCCDEYQCRRKQPYRIFRGYFSGTVYLGTRYTVKDNGDGTGLFNLREKHDISEAMAFFIRENADYVRSVLDETRDQGVVDHAVTPAD